MSTVVFSVWRKLSSSLAVTGLTAYRLLALLLMVNTLCRVGCVYSLLMRANKLETATVQGSLTCLALS